jgi:lysophospholipase L1-like esterase
MAVRIQPRRQVEEDESGGGLLVPLPFRPARPRKRRRIRRLGTKARRRQRGGRLTLDGRPDRNRPSRQVGPAGRVLVIGAVCFGLWLFAAAPALLRTAEASPLGIRRSTALVVLRPVARISAFLGLDRLGAGIDRALGRREDTKPRTPPLIPQRPPILEPRPVITNPPKTRASKSKGEAVTAALLGQYAEAGREFLRARNQFALPPPTERHPITVMTIGDSVASDLGHAFERLVTDRGGFRVRIDARVSTGLARQDYFDWPYQIAVNVRDFRPDVVVALFGVNDAGNGFFIGGHGVPFGTSEWKRGYQDRVAKIMKMITKSGRPVIWVGMPIVAERWRANGVRRLNEIFRIEARKHEGVVYLDAWKLFADRNGGYSAYLPTRSGGKVQARQPDGVHLTMSGGDRLAEEVYDAMSRFWRQPDYVG